MTVTPNRRSCSALSGLLLSRATRDTPSALQHLRGDDVAALVLAVAEREVRLVGVQPGVLQRVGVELGVQADAAPLLPQVEQEAAGLGDPLDGLAQLRAAVAALAAEHVAGQALAVRPDERRRPASAGRDGGGPVAEPEGEVLPAVDQPVEGEHPGGRRVAVGEPQRHASPGCGSSRWAVAAASVSSRQSVRNRGESA